MPRRFVNMRFKTGTYYATGSIGVEGTSQTVKRAPADLTKREIEELYDFCVRSVPGRQVPDGTEYSALLAKLNIGSDDAFWITKHKYRPEVTVPLARKYFPNQFPEPKYQATPIKRRPTYSFENAVIRATGALLQHSQATCRALFEVWRGPSSQP